MQRPLVLLLLALSLAPACKRVPPSTAPRDSGQSGLMGGTFAGQNACNPKNHLRPFIIEWDATDMSSFESHAASDIVVVRYEGCELVVLDECRNDSIRGSQGAYKPPEWTTGSLEKINIATQGELYAKLPLGAASLGGRVAGGEKFAMEYYVAGTRNATRDAVYRGDLAANPGCEGATHFVYGYNLGAFALGSVADFSAEVGASVYGFGAGGKTSSKREADKKGGDLAVCRSDTATEVAGCKAPIRLTLRAIRDGENPDRAAMRSTDNNDALNAAGKVDARLKMKEDARAYYDSANQKMNARDGKGCLAELDRFDKVDPDHKSTDPKSPYSVARGQCLMLAGKCDVGKVALRKSYEQQTANQSPEQIDKIVESTAVTWCEGKLSPRDATLRALAGISVAASQGKPTPATCAEHYKVLARSTVKPRDEDDLDIIRLPDVLWTTVPACFNRAGDCKQAWSAFVAHFPTKDLSSDPATRQASLTANFENYAPKCKDFKP
jgi:hypothetical protein